MNGVLHAVDIQGPISLTTLGWTFTFANDVPPRKKDVITLRCANLCTLTNELGETHAYNSISKILFELMNKPPENIWYSTEL